MNLRVIKKDVDFIVDEFLSDALLSYSFAKEGAKQDKIMEVINEAIAFRDETIKKISHPEGNTKAYYKTVRDNFNNTIDTLFDKLSAAVK